MWSPGSSWFRDPALSGGGALIDLGVHLADAIRWITGDDLAEVSADVRGAPVEEEATVVFRLARGARGSFEVGWFEPAFALTIDGTGGRFEADASTTGEPGPDPWAAFARAIVEGTPPEPSGEDGRAALAAVRAAYDSAAAGSSIGMG
jgi:predicted dehydrogenase